MAAVHAFLLAKDINNNILAALPVKKMSAQALNNQRSVVQPGLRACYASTSTGGAPSWPDIAATAAPYRQTSAGYFQCRF